MFNIMKCIVMNIYERIKIIKEYNNYKKYTKICNLKGKLYIFQLCDKLVKKRLNI